MLLFVRFREMALDNYWFVICEPLLCNSITLVDGLREKIPLLSSSKFRSTLVWGEPTIEVSTGLDLVVFLRLDFYPTLVGLS